MKNLRLEFAGRSFIADPDDGLDIAIALDFSGAQPNHFGAEPAASHAMRSGDFIGDVRAGGSCNASVLRLNPHCNGTHTECFGHVTGARHHVLSAAPPLLLPAALVSVEPEVASNCGETSVPPPKKGDSLITAEALARAWGKLAGGEYPALVVRTLPNDSDKKSRKYTASNSHPYFSLAAVAMLVECGVQHLLVDTPSIDRFDDDGKLSGHRLFWGLEPGAVEAGPATRRQATITEMIYVDSSYQDGVYLLNLQLPPFLSDAAPSRPVLFRAEVS